MRIISKSSPATIASMNLTIQYQLQEPQADGGLTAPVREGSHRVNLGKVTEIAQYAFAVSRIMNGTVQHSRMQCKTAA